jgi:ATP-dependent Clp protease ATP-binding subunit ClpB
MNRDHFPYKAYEELVSAKRPAISLGHAKITLHLASILISDPIGIFFQVISNVGGEELASELERVLKQALKKLPTQSPPADYVSENTFLDYAILRRRFNPFSLLHLTKITSWELELQVHDFVEILQQN